LTIESRKAVSWTPIGYVVSPRTEPIDDGWDQVAAQIVFDPAVLGDDALLGIEAFSHIEVFYSFHKVDETAIQTGARHPRERQDWPKVGILAQRGKGRPNRLGATICRLVSVEALRINVLGLDAIDGSPVIDVKPVMSGFLPRGTFIEPVWAREIMSPYWDDRD
jgi:tRNA (Thr-GGU) A37 N-methylase